MQRYESSMNYHNADIEATAYTWIMLIYIQIHRINTPTIAYSVGLDDDDVETRKYR